jgi:hypothetical protein
MAALKIDPMKLPGPWADGYVLERQHPLTSEFLGHDSFGNPQFDTKRTELGELVFRLKHRNDTKTLDPIAETEVLCGKTVYSTPATRRIGEHTQVPPEPLVASLEANQTFGCGGNGRVWERQLQLE